MQAAHGRDAYPCRPCALPHLGFRRTGGRFKHTVRWEPNFRGRQPHDVHPSSRFVREVTFAGAEWLCVLIVIVASVSLGWTPEQDPVVEPAVIALEGTVTLATRDAMDALGLQEFQPGAVATIDLTRDEVEAPPCGDCEHPLTGIMVQGPVVLTGLVDEAGRLGRIEANLNLTHLMERGPDGFVHREWLLLDWDAGDRSSTVEVLLVHDPPRWLPGDDRSDATLLTTDEGQISRSGPDLLLQSSESGDGVLLACLPDHFLCRATSPDAILTARRDVPRAPFGVAAPPAWVEVPLAAGNITDAGGWARSLLEVGEEVSNNRTWCSTSGSMLAGVTREVTAPPPSLAPLATWFIALGEPHLLLAPEGVHWTEANDGEVRCAALTDANGALRLGVAEHPVAGASTG